MITQVMDRWGNIETIHFELEDESTRETIENCGYIFGRWWNDEIIAYSCDSMVWTNEGRATDLANLETFGNIEGARINEGKALVTAGSLAHAKACELWDSMDHFGFVLDETLHYEKLRELNERDAAAYVDSPKLIFGSAIGDELLKIEDFEVREAVMGELLNNEELTVAEAVEIVRI